MKLSKVLHVSVIVLLLVTLLVPVKVSHANGENVQQVDSQGVWVEVGNHGAQLLDAKENGEVVLEASQGTEFWGQVSDDGWLIVKLKDQTYYLNLSSAKVLSDKGALPESNDQSFTLVPKDTVLKAESDDSKIIKVLREIYLPNKTNGNGENTVILGDTAYTLQDSVSDVKEDNLPDSSSGSGNSTTNDVDKEQQAQTFTKYFKVVKETPVYDGSSLDSKIVGYLGAGELFKRNETLSIANWHEIDFGGKAGFVNAADTIPTDSYSVTNQAPENTKTYGTLTVTGKAPVYDNTRIGQGLVQFASIAANETFPIVSKYGDDWWEVVVDGRIGYIYKSIIGNVSMPFQSSDQYFKVTSNHVTVYDNSTGRLVPIGTLVKDQVYPRVSDYGDWHQIKFGNRYGYVWKAATIPASSSQVSNLNSGYKNSNQVIKILADRVVYAAGMIPIATLNSGTTYPIVGDSGDWWQVLVADRVGYVYKSEYATRDFTIDDHYFKVIQDHVTIYDNSTGKLLPVGTLIKGQVYPRVNDYGDWHQISFGKGYGYVWEDATVPASKENVTGIDSGEKNSGDYITIRSDRIVYAAGKVPMGILNQGVKYPIIGDDGDWWKISFSGRIGYVYKSIYATRNFRSSDHFFETLQDNVTVYDNSSGKLVPIGKLSKDRIYPRLSDYGDWNQIKYAGKLGYVWKDATAPVDLSHSKHIPILAYHNLTDKVSDGANISPARFREHMEYFKNKGYETITLDQLLDFLNGQGSLPKKPLMITMDDSYLSQYTEAYPILKDLNMKATYFAISGWLGQKLGTLPEFTWDEAREMEATGLIDIESHTYASHDTVNGKPLLSNPLPGETNDQYISRISNDLTMAKTVLEKQLGKKVRALAYPFGSWNQTVKEVAVNAGYEALFLYNEGPGIVYSGEDPLMINRYGVNGNLTGEDVWKKFLQ